MDSSISRGCPGETFASILRCFGDDVFERCFRDHDGLNELNICKYNYYILKTDELIFVKIRIARGRKFPFSDLMVFLCRIVAVAGFDRLPGR